MNKKPQNPYFFAGVTAFLVIAAAILVFFAVFHFKGILSFLSTVNRILRPIYYGAVLAFLLLPIHRAILRFLTGLTPDSRLSDRRNLSFLNAVAIILSLLFAALVIYILLAMVLPQVYESVVGLVQSIPGYFMTLQERLMEFLANNPDIQTAVMPYYNSVAVSVEEWLQSDLLPNLESVNSSLSWFQQEIVPRLTSMFSSVSAVFIALLMLAKDLLIAVIVSVYLLARKDIFSAQAKKIVYSVCETRWADLIVEEVRNAYRIMSGFINGKLLDSLIIGIIALVCCNLFNFPYPALLAVIIGVTNVIPFFGPFIGAIPCALLILIISPIQCVYFVIFILVLQQFDGNILGPKMMEAVTVNFTYPFLKKVEQLADDKTMILLCPKTTLALIGTEKAKFVDHQLEEPIGYAQACIHMIGKAHFAGQMCIKNVGYQLNHGIFKEVKLL